jgi:glutathione transport system ATP-binding protein
MNAPTSLLAIDGLTVEFRTAERNVTAVRDLSLTIGHGETVAVVGESGSGKSVTALSVMRLVEHGGGRIATGSIRFHRPGHDAIDLVTAGARTMRQVRGGEIAMIFQEPMTSLNPVFPVGDQIAEAIELHQDKSAGASRRSSFARGARRMR